MGNQVPKEHSMGDRLRCCLCSRVLPPCWSYNDYYKTTIHGRFVYVFNGGEYYRSVGHNESYECRDCFYKPIHEAERMREEERRRQEEERQREEERRREEEERRRQEEERRRQEEERQQEEERRGEEEERRRQEEERRRQEEERQREEERRREEELDRRLEESQRHVEDQQEREMSRMISEEYKFVRHVLKSHLDEFEDQSQSYADHFLEILSNKCGIPDSKLSLDELSGGDLVSVLSALDRLLFDEWIRSPPTLSTLQHAKLFLAELCALCIDGSEGVSVEATCDRVHSVMEPISQSASNASETFLLAQALHLTVMQLLTNRGTAVSEAALVAQRWAQALTAEDLFLIEFLGTLISSLQKTVDRATIYILDMEVQCLKILLLRLTHLHGFHYHRESIDLSFKLVQTNQWTPAEAVALLQVLSEKIEEDSGIVQVLLMIQAYDISPLWRDNWGNPLNHILVSIPSERYQEQFQMNLRRKDVSILDSALEEFKSLRGLEDSRIDMMREIIGGVLQYSQSPPNNDPFKKESFTWEKRDADEIRSALYELCKVVHKTKGWWPTVQHMLKWCELILNTESETPETIDVEDDPCVTAMFAAAKVCMGNKMDIVLSPDVQSLERVHQWYDFYHQIGISVNTNMDPSVTRIYQTDVVYGAMNDFVCDYLKDGFQVMTTGSPPLNRGYIFDYSTLSAFHTMELSRLQEDKDLMTATVMLQSLIGDFINDNMEVRHRFVKVLFQVLHMKFSEGTDPNNKIAAISQKFAGQQLPANEIYVLTFFQSLLEALTKATEGDKNEMSLKNPLCFEILIACAVQFLPSKEQAEEVYQMVFNLASKQLWSPIEALNLLVVLIENHHDENCVSIKKILHLMETYQVSSEWTDEENQSVNVLANLLETAELIPWLEKSFREEKEKSLNCLIEEIRQMKSIDEQTLDQTHSVVKAVLELIKSGDIKNHNDVEKVRNVSQSTTTEDVQEILSVLCNAVHIRVAKQKWWPRINQMISWCLLALSDKGKLLEMGTGEGKSCVIAMLAALRVLRGEKVDVVSSSSVLCQRDAEDWSKFYSYFDITVDTNTDKKEDDERRECYKKDVVYGTIEAFAADHLRQIFEMKDVRTDRSYECIIIDEVDSLLLDQGVQLTYLSSPMASMQHLNNILAMIWSHVSQYGFLSTGKQTFIQGPSTVFCKGTFDSINTEDTEIKDPMDILRIAEDMGVLPAGFTEDICQSEKEQLLEKLKSVSQDAMLQFFHEIEDYVPYGFTVYTLDDNGVLCLQKPSSYDDGKIPVLKFLVLDEGLCCPLYDSDEMLIKPIAEMFTERIQYTPCTNMNNKISVPGFLKNLIETKMFAWVQNAFLAKRLREGREYVVENGCVRPVDFRSTGIIEVNKKWGDGLQQFVEIKHKVKLSTISTVTNYVSNIAFFEKYHGKIYGTTGTLGNEAELQFLYDLYPNFTSCKIPTFNRRKLFEVKGILKTSADDWKNEIKRLVMKEILPNSYRRGRASLVICETINKAKEVHEMLQSTVQGKTILFCRSDKDSLSKIDEEFGSGDVIVATNLAGRGTDIKISKEVNNNGGLFVVLTFLSENTRVEFQAFGRTARKGKPGSAQIIMNREHLEEDLRHTTSVVEAKKIRDRLAVEKMDSMMSDVTEMRLREELFAEYCKTLQEMHQLTDPDEKKAVVAIMNEFWGIWLQTKSEDIEKLKREELQRSLTNDISLARSQSKSQTSPCSSIYHYINFGNLALDKKQWDASLRLFEKAMNQDPSWAAIAFYNHAYCTIKNREEEYFTKALDDLNKAQDSLKYLSEDYTLCLQFIKMSSGNKDASDSSTLEKQLAAKTDMLSYLDKNINEAIDKLREIKQKDKNAIAKKAPMFTLVSEGDEDLQVEAFNLYSQGLQYVFSVEEEPVFPWQALLVFFLGILQIIAGALLVAFTYGALAQFGIGMISEGIMDCITGIESMVTGEFSFKSWAIEKAVSVALSLIGFGVGKLIAKGFKVTKIMIKGFGKQLKSMPKFISSQIKHGISSVAKTNMKNVLKVTAKTLVERLVSYGLDKAEEALVKEILTAIKKDLKKGIADNIKTNLEQGPLAASVDSIVLSHIESKEQLADLLLKKRSKLEDIFKGLSKTALQPFQADLAWQNKLNTSITKVIDSAMSEANGKIKIFLTIVKTVHMASLGADALVAVLILSEKFIVNLNEELEKFKSKAVIAETIKTSDLSPSEMEMLAEFKRELAGGISALLADVLVEVFHQKFSSHIVSLAKDKANGYVRHHVRSSLKTPKTEQKLQAGQSNSYLSYVLANQDANAKHGRGSGKLSISHAERIRKPKTAGTALDVKVLSETTGTEFIIMTQTSDGCLGKMQEIKPEKKDVSQTVTLIYRPRSSEYPDGHYDVFLNNSVVRVTGKDKNVLYRAIARGLNPEAGEEENDYEAANLRSLEAEELLEKPVKWEPYIKRKGLIQAIRGGPWYKEKGDAPKKTISETEQMLRQDVGKVELYKNWQKYAGDRQCIGHFISGDRQPPPSTVVVARNLDHSSRLAAAMCDEARMSSTGVILDVQNIEIPAVYVPIKIHREFDGTKLKVFRMQLATTISKDDVVATFKLTVLGSMPKFMLNSDKISEEFQNNHESKSRLDTFERSFKQHSIQMIHAWFKPLHNKGVMTDEDLQLLTDWMGAQEYKDQNDPYTNQVSSLFLCKD